MKGFGNKRTSERIESCEKWEKKDLTRDLSKSPTSSNMFLAFSEKEQLVKCKKAKSWTDHGFQCFLIINTNLSVEIIQYLSQKGFSVDSFSFQCDVTVMMVMLKSGRNTAICWTIMKRISVVLRLTICCLFSAFQVGRSRHAHILEQPGVKQTTYYEISANVFAWS